jgi:hypothetical protein
MALLKPVETEEQHFTLIAALSAMKATVFLTKNFNEESKNYGS